MVYRIFTMFLCSFVFVCCKTSDSGKKPTSPVQVNPDPSNQNRTPTSGTKQAGRSYLRCEIKNSNDRTDYSDMSDQDFKAYYSEEPNTGILCLYMAGNNSADLEAECHQALTKIKAYEDKNNTFKQPLKAYLKPTDDAGFCKEKAFSSENSECNCTVNNSNIYVTMTGSAQYCAPVSPQCNDDPLGIQDKENKKNIAIYSEIFKFIGDRLLTCNSSNFYDQEALDRNIKLGIPSCDAAAVSSCKSCLNAFDCPKFRDTLFNAGSTREMADCRRNCNEICLGKDLM